MDSSRKGEKRNGPKTLSSANIIELLTREMREAGKPVAMILNPGEGEDQFFVIEDEAEDIGEAIGELRLDEGTESEEESGEEE